MSIDFNNKGFWGAIAMFVVVVGITVSLFFIEIPEKNNDVIKLIIGVLVGSLSPIVFSILGKDPEELEKKNLLIESLRKENEELRGRIDSLYNSFVNLQDKVITELAILKGIK